MKFRFPQPQKRISLMTGCTHGQESVTDQPSPLEEQATQLARRTLNLGIALALVSAVLVGTLMARPLPSARLHGFLILDGERLTRQAPDFASYTIEVYPAGTHTNPLATYVMGSKADAEDEYAIQVPLNTDGPLSSGGSVDLWVGEVKSVAGWTVTSGTTERLDLVASLDRPPTIVVPSPIQVSEGQTLSLDLQAIDPEGDAITWEGYGLPPGATLSASGALRYTAGYEDAGSYALTLIARSREQQDTESLSLTVLPTDRPPIFEPLAPVNMGEGETVQVQLQAADPDGDAVTFEGEGLPPRMSISPEGLVQFTPDYSQAGQYTVTLVARAGSASVAIGWTLTVAQVGRPPTLTVPNPIAVREGQSLTLHLRGVDPDGDAILYSAVGLPEGSFLNESTGALTLIPSHQQAGSYPVTFRATTAEDVTEVSSTIEVTEVDQPPVFELIATQYTSVGSSVKFEVHASDPDGDEVRIDATNVPTNAFISDNTFYFSPDKTQNNYQYLVTFLAYSKDVSATMNVLIVVGTNMPPVFKLADEFETNETQELTFKVYVYDPDGDPVTLSALALPKGAVFDPATTVFRWTPSYGQSGVHYPTFGASDGDSFTQFMVTVIVNDVNRPPVIAPMGTLKVRYGHPLNYTIRAYDPDNQRVTFTLDSEVPGLSLTKDSGQLHVAEDAEFREAKVVVTAHSEDKSSVTMVGVIIQVEEPVASCTDPVAVASPAGSKVTLYCPDEYDDPVAWLEGEAGEGFGRAVLVRDLDGDSLPELVVGAPDFEAGRGRVLIFNGQRLVLGGQLYLWEALALSGDELSRFGTSLAAVGTASGTRLMIGAPGADGGYGLIAVTDANELVSRPAIDEYLLCGYFAEGCGEVMTAAELNGDLEEELIVGAPAGQTGEVDIFRSGAVESSGTPWIELRDSERSSSFGAALATATVDDRRLLLVGAPLAQGLAAESSSGRVNVYRFQSGAPTPVLLDTALSRVGLDGDRLGTALWAMGDLRAAVGGEDSVVWAGAPGCGQNCTGQIVQWSLRSRPGEVSADAAAPTTPEYDRVITGFLPGENFGSQLITLGARLVVSASDASNLLPGAAYVLDVQGNVESSATGTCEAEGFGTTLSGLEGTGQAQPIRPIPNTEKCVPPYTTLPTNDDGINSNEVDTPTPAPTDAPTGDTPGPDDSAGGCGCTALDKGASWGQEPPQSRQEGQQTGTWMLLGAVLGMMGASRARRRPAHPASEASSNRNGTQSSEQGRAKGIA